MKLQKFRKALLREISLQLGIDERQARQAVAALIPKLSAHLAENLRTPEGREALFSALRRGRHQEYMVRPDALHADQARDEGSKILNHIFGSRRATRKAAEEASSRTAQQGLDASKLEKVLPLVATAAMAVLSRKLPRLLLRSPLAAVAGIAVMAVLRGLVEDSSSSEDRGTFDPHYDRGE